MTYLLLFEENYLTYLENPISEQLSELIKELNKKSVSKKIYKNVVFLYSSNNQLDKVIRKKDMPFR